MRRAAPLVFLLGCTGGGEVDPGGVADVQIPCATAEPEGLAVRLWWPAADSGRHLSQAPVLVRVGGAGSVGFDIGHDPSLAVEQGAAVVQFLRPGVSDDGRASGGIDDFGGASTSDSLACVVAYLDGEVDPIDGETFAAQVPHASVTIATGISVGGNLVLNAAHQGMPVDGVVLWESPLVDQLVLQEPTLAGGVLDPDFVPGSCTLDGGCPFPERGPRLRWSDLHDSLYQDLDTDGFLDDEEPAYTGLKELSTDVAMFYSRELAAEAEHYAFAVDTPPTWWQTDAERDAFWSQWDSTEALVAIRDGSTTPFVYLARGVDHVQLVHDHVLVAQEGLIGADFFRLNADAAYIDTLGGGQVSEQPAGTTVTDLGALDALPMVDVPKHLLSGELELADRAWLGVWDPDLDGVLSGL